MTNNGSIIILATAIALLVIIGAGSIIYINETNKLYSDPINTNITVVSFQKNINPLGFAYMSIIDSEDKGYVTVIGESALPVLTVGDTYDITYGCDSENNRRITSITPASLSGLYVRRLASF